MLTSILVFLIVLSILILIHEFGHFWAARKSGVWVEEFGIGLPPRLWSKKKGETVYSINALPFGGFVRLHGENTDEDLRKPTRAFVNKSKKVRIFIVTAGVVMNFLLAGVAFGIVYSFTGVPRETNEVKVLEVDVGSPAQESGVLVGDIVKTYNKVEIDSTEVFVAGIDETLGKRVTLEVERNVEGTQEIKTLSIKPREEHPEDEGPLGVVISTTEIYYAPIWQRPFIGAFYGFRDALLIGKAIIVIFWQILVDFFTKGVAPKDVSGPVGIYAATNEATKYGALAVINFMGILSVNLAILNILPFPALDGGRLVFIFIEKAIGKRVWPKFEATVHAIGMIILIALLLAITVKDIRGLISAGSISKFFEGMLN